MTGLSDVPILPGLPRVEAMTPFLETIVVPRGAVVVREGEQDRDMFFVLTGTARILHGSLELGRLQPGDHFGELGLLAGKPRSATIIADTPMELARLSREQFDKMSSAEPALAFAFTIAIVRTVGTWLTEMTENVEMLLSERSLPRRTQLELLIGGETRRVRTGTPLLDVLPREVDGEQVVAGLLDRRPVSLVTRVSSDGTLEPLTTGHWEGRRIYRDSVGLLLLEAAARRFPHLVVRLEHSIGFAQHVAVQGIAMPSRLELSNCIEAEMRAIVEEDLRLREEWWTVEEARTYFERVGWTGASELLAMSRDATVSLVAYGDVYIRHRPLCPRTGMLTGFRIRADEEGVLLVFGDRAPTEAPLSLHTTLPPGPRVTLVAEAVSSHTRSMMSEHRRWLKAIGATTVGEFNRACIEGNVPQLVRVAEGFQEKQIGQIADAIAERGDETKVVCIAGPSSSGKTTFIKRLRVQLQVNALVPVNLSLDDYYVDRDATPRDDKGELDYESLGALDRGLLEQHLERLLAGEDVVTARYDFQTGLSIPDGGPLIHLRNHELLLLEGIHGLNPGLLGGVASSKVFRVFICPLAQLPFDRFARVHASDVRLLRRIVRDRHTRGATAASSILRWPSVRRGERLHIFPYQQHADAVFDTSLIYELSVLKVYAERYLLEVPQRHAAYPTAFRLLRLLDQFVALYPDHVPQTSILREFIGGSGFEY